MIAQLSEISLVWIKEHSHWSFVPLIVEKIFMTYNWGRKVVSDLSQIAGNWEKHKSWMSFKSCQIRLFAVESLAFIA